MTRHIKRGGKVWINIFPDKPVTEKPAETRMGSGKGNPEHWVAVVRPGRILFELSYPDADVAREALDRAIQKLPIKARFVTAGGGALMAKPAAAAALRDLTDDHLIERLVRGEGRAAEAALPPRHRPARQPRRAEAGASRDRPHQHRDPRPPDRRCGGEHV